ncbi:endonuclease Q family protein [Methanoculleus sp. FWC-SCC1]|uniref:Endonuclease Q family protein n=1 Tax=Methanoculleus frigidifontis TaxID=2584085 RepID=A0ABT8MB43_9EURY|nr:endonuclease Q family protein [Methanoculleus sp. FWC-SCC1]MDN7025158.1 endonuclease Q family protein [Methanoculleus sp. FWC-SCC1]
MLLYADLHIHSPYSMATSRTMTPDALLNAAGRKGLGILGSGDALHPAWRQCWIERQEDETEIVVVPTTEVEDAARIHHLIVMEDFGGFADLAGLLADHSRNLVTAGRPRINLSGEAIAERVHDLGGLIGPAHAFTPWTSLYAHAGSVRECYGTEPIDFLELGLSADSSYGAGIADLAGVPFLSNSDAHSTAPHRLGREFSGLAVASRTPAGVLDALRQGRIAMNAGFFPEEGKYNRTACIACYRQYTRQEAEGLGWRCPADGKRIKKGVADRAAELADTPPQERPPYLHTIPLGEIVMQVLGTCSPTTRKCIALYETLLETLGDEIAILVSIPVPEIAAVHAGVGSAIGALRSGQLTLHPGGGGRYGSFSFP